MNRNKMPEIGFAPMLSIISRTGRPEQAADAREPKGMIERQMLHASSVVRSTDASPSGISP